VYEIQISPTLFYVMSLSALESHFKVLILFLYSSADGFIISSFKRLPNVMHVIGMVWLFTLCINFSGLRTDSVYPFFVSVCDI
jgi:hypothetical protein